MSQPAGQGGGLPKQSRVVLVTGASAGIGFHTAKQIAAGGTSVLPLLRASVSPRCVNVTSSLAWLAREVPGDLLSDIHSTRDYVGIRAHARAKLLTAAWTLAMSRYPATVAASATQDQVLSTARDLMRDAPTTAGHLERP